MRRRAYSLILVGWLAGRAVRTSPMHTLLRVLVGTLAVLVVLLALTLDPTAHARSERSARSVLPVEPRTLAEDGVLAAESDDYFAGQPITIRSFARVGAGGGSSSLGVALPVEGSALVSPALAAAIRHNPELARRYAIPIAGLLPERVLLGPRSLVMWRGVAESAMPPDAGWLAPRPFKGTDDIAAAIPTEVAYAVPMLVLGFAVPLVALMVLLSTFGLARREHRLAALRLLGLSDRSARASAALESGLAAALSSLLGLAVFTALEPALAAHSPVSGGVWPQDVSVPAGRAGLVLVLVPVLAVGASWLSLRSLKTGALSVERRSRQVQVRTLPVLLVAVGAGAAVAAHLELLGGRDLQAQVVIGGTLVAIGGVLGSLPWVLSSVVPWVAAMSRDLPSLIAARRVQAAPGRAGRVATGLAVMVVVAGPLLVFFPLIADLGAGSLGRLSARVGASTLLTQHGAGEVGTAQWDTALAAEEVQADLAVWTVQLAGPSVADEALGSPLTVLVADCADLRAVLAVRESECERGLRLPGSADAVPRRATLVEERVDEVAGTVGFHATGREFALPDHPVESPELADLVDGMSTAATIMIPRSRLGPTEVLDSYPRTQFIQVVSPARLEAVRTAVIRETAAEALTLGERESIARRTTREFELVARIAALLITVIAAGATAITVADVVAATQRETTLLRIGGAPRHLTSRALLVQVALPTLAMVLPAAALSLLFAAAFAGLLDFAAIPIPIRGIAVTASAALVGPLLATLAVERLYRDNSLISAHD